MPVDLFTLDNLNRPERRLSQLLPKCCGFRSGTILCQDNQRHAPKHGGIFGFCARCVSIYPSKYTRFVPAEFEAFQRALETHFSQSAPDTDEDGSAPDVDEASGAAQAQLVRCRADVQGAYLEYQAIPTFKCPGIYPDASPADHGYRVLDYDFNGKVIRIRYSTCVSPVTFKCGHVSGAPVCSDPIHNTQWETYFQPGGSVEGVAIPDSTTVKSDFLNVIGQPTSSQAAVMAARGNVITTFVQYLARQKYLNQLEQAREPVDSAPAIARLTLGNILPQRTLSRAQKRAMEFSQLSERLTERSKSRRLTESVAADGVTSGGSHQLGSPGASSSHLTQQPGSMPPLPEGGGDNADEDDIPLSQLAHQQS